MKRDGDRGAQPSGAPLERAALQPAHVGRHPSGQRRHLHLRRLRQLPHPLLYRRRRVQVSWGEPGIDAGQFIRPHNIAVDGDDRILVVDREAHRVQIFDPEGGFITMWSNIHRPDAMVLWQDNIYIGELNGMGGVDDAPGLGHRVTIYDLQGNRVGLFGSKDEGEGAGEFIAPHGIAVDSTGAVYVAEVSYTIRGSHMDPAAGTASFSKYERVR